MTDIPQYSTRHPIAPKRITSEFLGTGLALLLMLAPFEGRSAERSSEAPSLERAGTTDSIDALLRLGDLYRGSELGAADPAKALQFYREAADAGSAIGRLRIGEMLARGEGIDPDIEQGRGLVGDVLKSNDTATLIALGQLYSGGSPQLSDPSAAEAAYTKALTLGDESALMSLGDLYSEGTATKVDLEKAFDFYRQALEAGSGGAQTQVALMLIRGQGVARDVDKGLALLNERIAAGSGSELVALGDIYANGETGQVDEKAALDAYEQADAQGHVEGTIRLAEAYAGGYIVRKDLRKSLAYYQKAAAVGNATARLAIAEGFVENRFKGQGSVAEGIAMLKEAAAAGDSDALLTLSDCYLYGIGVPSDPGHALELIDAAADAGDISAALERVDIYREGRSNRGRKLIKKDVAKAQTYLSAIESQLDFGTRTFETLLTRSASAPIGKFAALYEEMQLLAPRDRAALVRRLLRVNPNGYVYVVQMQLQKLGLFQPAPNGLLDSPTKRAIASYCKSKDAERLCREGPMSGPTAQLIAAQF